MTKIKKSIQINAPLEEVFEYFANPENLPEIWPSMLEVSNVVRHNGTGSFDWIYKMAGMRFNGHSEVVELEANERMVTRSKKGIATTVSSTYTRVGNMTKVSVEIDYEIPGRLLRKMADPIVRRLNDRETSTLLSNLKDRMELSESTMKRSAAHSGSTQPLH